MIKPLAFLGDLHDISKYCHEAVQERCSPSAVQLHMLVCHSHS